MDSILTMGTASYSHTYGNIVEAVKMDILSKFPPDYFKYTHVSTQLAFRQFKRIRDNSMIEFKKQERPKIYIRPTFEVQDDSLPFVGTLLTEHMSNGTGYISRQSLMPVFRDSEKHVALDFRMNRDRVQFDITIQVETIVGQLDLYKNMLNMISWNAPHTKVFSLESMIPRPMVQYLADNANIEMDDSPGTIGTVVSYLQTHGTYPITYKIRNSSSLDEFFMYYQVPVLITYSDFSIDEGNKRNMTDDGYGISFRITCDFNHPGAYVIRSVNGIPYKVPHVLRVNSDERTELFPLYTLERIYEDRDQVLEGFKLYFVTTFKTEKENETKEDYISLSDIVESNYVQIIKKYLFSHIPSDILMRTKVYRDSDLLEEDVDYTVDWNTMELRILHSDPYVTYRVILYANMTKFQEEFQILAELDKRDKTYANLENGVATHDVWRDRENNILTDANGSYFMPKSESSPNLSYFTDDRTEIDYKG